MLDFQNALQAFLDSVFQFVTDLLNTIFGSLAAFFGGFTFP